MSDKPLVLHGLDGPWFMSQFLDALGPADVPTGPGWDGTEPPVWLRSVDDLSYLLLDSIREPVAAVGLSFGAWVLLEAATKDPSRFTKLALVSPVGVKLNGRDERQFADLHALSLPERARALYRAEAAAPPLGALDDSQLTQLAYAQQAVARFGWEPYLHSRTLAHRLHRVRGPVLIAHGADDRFVPSVAYYRELARLFTPHAQVVSIDGAGHRVEEEQPGALARAVTQFLGA